MVPYLRLGPFLLPMASLSLLIGVWLGSWISEKRAVRLGIKSELISNLIFIGLIAGLIGARLAYSARFINAYIANPLGLFALTPNTLSIPEGFIIGLITAFIYGQRKKLGIRLALDALAPGLAVFLVFLGLAHLLSGDAFGTPSGTPWSIYLWNEYRHPTQIYEILLALIILFIILKYPLQAGSGRDFWLVIALSSAARLFLEAFRGDSMIWYGFRATQIIALIVLIVSLWMLHIWIRPSDETE